MKWVIIAALIISSVTLQAEALEEVNLQRSHLGLPAVFADAHATAFAQRKAEYQAARGIKGFYPMSTRSTGMNGHEGPIYDRPHVEGTGCSTQDGPWLTCAMRSLGSPRVGAGVAIGPDGYRYMVLIVLGRKHRDGGKLVTLINTAHLTPEAPRVAPHSGGNQRRAATVCSRCGKIH
jgi:hypothetical protein